ncbi:MAG: hypothetical protein CFE23_07445 [Flavobacterium sp. BFFFF1]|uniref:glycosyltransferase family 2 protein n=1 Tax=Flavobacterium sp. BFFFF1 TaxID=2015557 RepID=UPI000BCA2620|nr:glycosyltransferase family 2 protein [Flavobacterium sp. BFFFF1]OYU80794.1 MAG: hypothetical protein CFE23_07445 [Flavobacterium sp. BFFFF1]
MKNPAISVILPVYNCEKYIAEALGSILNQAFANFEVFVIDDASTDATLDVISKFNDPRIKLITKAKNTGYTDSLNMGLKFANGKYIARMDGDDIAMPDRFEKQYRLMEDRPDIIVCGTWLSIIASERVIQNPENHEQILLQLLYKNPIGHPSVFIRKDAITSLEYDKFKEPAEDYDLWSKMIWLGHFYNIQQPLMQYRQHELQVSNTKNNKQTRHFNESRILLFKRLHYDVSMFPDSLVLKILNREFALSGKEFRLMLKWFHEVQEKNRNKQLYQVKEFIEITEQMKNSFIGDYFLMNKFKGIIVDRFFSLPPRLMYFVVKVCTKYFNRQLYRKLGISY